MKRVQRICIQLDEMTVGKLFKFFEPILNSTCIIVR